jgi:hypothetical protein
LAIGFGSIGESYEDCSFVLFVGVATPVATLPMLAAAADKRGLARTTACVIATAATDLAAALA